MGKKYQCFSTSSESEYHPLYYMNITDSSLVSSHLISRIEFTSEDIILSELNWKLEYSTSFLLVLIKIRRLITDPPSRAARTSNYQGDIDFNQGGSEWRGRSFLSSPSSLPPPTPTRWGRVFVLLIITRTGTWLTARRKWWWGGRNRAMMGRLWILLITLSLLVSSLWVIPQIDWAAREEL